MRAQAAARGVGVPLLLLACRCPREASAGIVGEAFSAALAQPLLRGVRSWGAINATTATIPFFKFAEEEEEEDEEEEEEVLASSAESNKGALSGSISLME